MDSPLRYFWRVLCAAVPGSLGQFSTWASVALGLGLPLLTWLLGEKAGLTSDQVFYLSWGILAAVVAIRLAVAPYTVYKQDAATAEEEAKKAEAIANELASFRNPERKAHLLVLVRESATEVLAAAARVASQEKADDWCKQYDEWLELVNKAVESNVSRADAHLIFTVGDATVLDVIDLGFGDNFNLKVAAVRYYLNQLKDRLARYS